MAFSAVHLTQQKPPAINFAAYHDSQILEEPKEAQALTGNTDQMQGTIHVILHFHLLLTAWQLQQGKKMMDNFKYKNSV